jgi:hypothetical protein
VQSGHGPMGELGDLLAGQLRGRASKVMANRRAGRTAIPPRHCSPQGMVLRCTVIIG